MYRQLVAPVLVASMCLAACGAESAGSEPTQAVASTIAVPATVAGTAAPTTTSTTVPASTTTAATTTTSTAPGTTIAADTTVAPATTAATVGVSDLVLSDGGVGAVGFGTPDASTIDQLTPLLGAPTEDRRAAFPTADGSGDFIDENDVAFARPFGRFVCFANELCLSFGGATADALVFLGWHYQHQSDAHQPPDLFTAAGLGPGVSWADHLGDITLSDGGSCYSVGYGSAGGIALALLSSGDFFGSYDENGQYVATTPPPEQVTVMSMTAGETEYFLYGDC